ncbi:hypothetical protein [Treponema sp.]|uniref:hypothetical protein n=1 Tax=Treponema sp. TaxID=166 RepID=UPI00298E087E|nr:hypothetical protein [Treponema sp.]MCQ2240755.1 hypothetical protein [Treponema sp.]
MKKILMVVVAAIAFAAAAFAQEVDLTDATKTIKFPGDFNLGKWYDAKWDAYWEFESDNISLYKGDAKIVSFAGKIDNWKTTVSTRGLEITFDCASTNRSYKVTKPISASSDLELEVERHDVPDSDKNKQWKTTITRQQ